MQETQDKTKVQKGFYFLIQKIAFNSVFGDEHCCQKFGVLTHKQVRIIAKTAIIIKVSEWFDGDIDSQIEVYLWGLQSYGLSHKERMAIGREILDLISQQESRENAKSKKNEPDEF